MPSWRSNKHPLSSHPDLGNIRCNHGINNLCRSPNPCPFSRTSRNKKLWPPPSPPNTSIAWLFPTDKARVAVECSLLPLHLPNLVKVGLRRAGSFLVRDILTFGNAGAFIEHDATACGSWEPIGWRILTYIVYEHRTSPHIRQRV